jgi:DNA-binding beta-propeller fold protein YncE
LAPATARAAATQIYWTTAFGGVIERANTDGTGREVIAQAGTLPGGIALDMLHGKVYWTGVQGHAIRRSNLDGTAAETLLSPTPPPYGIALDPEGGKMYWTEGTFAHRIQRANLDGSGEETVLTIPSGYASNVELDLLNGYLYYTNTNQGGIYRADLNGQGLAKIIETGTSPIDLEFNPLDGKMYWTENGNEDAIRRANLDGTSVETLISSGLGNPLGIALDLRVGKMYWADYAFRTVQRANLDGLDVENIVSDPGGLYAPHHIAIWVPEPSTWSRMLIGCLGLGSRRQCRRRRG